MREHENIPIPEKSVSEEFKAWQKDDNKLKEFLEGSHVFTEPWDKEVAFKGWEDERRFITSGINKDGTILDYGCANGFLLRSLQEWSDHKLEPYGFDIDQEAIRKSQELFPNQPNHFVGPEDKKTSADFPKEFDFVYWNVWDDFSFEGPEGIELFQKLQQSTREGGRLILGFYDKREETLKKIETLKKLGFQPTHIIKNPKGEQLLAVFDKIPQET